MPSRSRYDRFVQPLPIDSHLAEIESRLAERRAAVIVAAPGAGKSTRVPARLSRLGKTILLQPRRVAARSLAHRIAGEQGWTLGREVGWHIRFERRYEPSTRLLLATEGILTAKLKSDPLLAEFTTVVLDEFHERSIHSDLAIALVREAWRARDDLRVVVMSATIDAEAVATYLDDAAIISVPGALHPVEIHHLDSMSDRDVLERVAPRVRRNLLWFLPGAREIESTRGAIAPAAHSFEIVTLHGSLTAEEQQRAIGESDRKRIILSTNVAETSVTVSGVTDVIDSGLQKVMRYDPATGIDALRTEWITRDAADQRAGRAGRLGPGRVHRLWDARRHLESHREPEIRRVDLASVVLDIHTWGGDARSFAWFEEPPPDRCERAIRLLELLGAIREGRVTDRGREIAKLPMHPRLAALFLDDGRSERAAVIGAMLASGRRARAAATVSSASDLVVLADQGATLPEIRREIDQLLPSKVRGDEERLVRAASRAYGDRLARRREAGSDRYLLASGRGAVLGRESSVRNEEFLVAIEITETPTEARITLASAVDPASIEANRIVVKDEIRGARARRFEQLFYDEILLGEREVPIDSHSSEAIERERFLRRATEVLAGEVGSRLRFAGFALDEVARRAFDEWGTRDAAEILSMMPWKEKQTLDREAPPRLRVPSGRDARLEYRSDGSVVAPVKLQELFGLMETPRVGSGRRPVVLELLSPAGRAVQTTSDLASFWKNTYPEIRKELRGRYPKHPWPEDPLTAEPTARAKPRR